MLTGTWVLGIVVEYLYLLAGGSDASCNRSGVYCWTITRLTAGFTQREDGF